MEYSLAELMTVVLARTLRDGEVGDVGAVSEIPMAACMLARRLHAPNLTWVGGASGIVNSEGPLVHSCCDYSLARSAEAIFDFAEMTDLILTHRPKRFDFSFLGGMQIDRFGNLNLAWVGPRASPSFWGPGNVGLPQISVINRFYIYLSRHDERTFVPAVDFVSGIGRNRPLAGREGPVIVVTPLAVLDFHAPDGSMRLVSVHPGQTAEAVTRRTGFPLVIDDVKVTSVPTAIELGQLRAHVDPNGVLREVKLRV